MAETSERVIKVGARGSELSRAQADAVIGELRETFPERTFELEIVKTSGDVDQTSPLASWSGRGVFVKELEAALLQNRIDAAVHSAKDLPTELPAGLILAAVLARETVEDVLVSREEQSLWDLPPGAKVATGSPRRRAQILRLRKDLEVVGVRGNVDTRLRKLAEGKFDVLVIARAGLKRLGLEERITDGLPVAEFPPAPGQGVIAVECRASDATMLSLLEKINHTETCSALQAERRLLETLKAGCSLPIAAWARRVDGEWTLDAAVYDLTGRKVITVRKSTRDDRGAAALGIEAARELIASGAEKLLKR